MSVRQLPAHPWSAAPGDVVAALAVSADRGLSPEEARQRLEQFGPNALHQVRPRSHLAILIDQFRSLLAGLLAVAAVVSYVFGEWVEGSAVVAVLVANGTIGFVIELRATKSMQALRTLGTSAAHVMRDGQLRSIPADQIVPGDIVSIEGGDVISADIRLIEASKLQANESTLTGESAPVEKNSHDVAEDAPLVERSSMLFKGSSVTRGAATGVVVATGMSTEVGHISKLVEEAKQEITPLERRLNTLGQGLLWLTLVVAAGVGLSAFIAGKPPVLAIETAIALAVASVPEGLPILATIALAHGMRAMARRNALVNRLSAVETLGATSILCCDKTGTLTENEMSVHAVVSCDGEHEVTDSAVHVRRAVELGVLCNNASLSKSERIGDPLEVALLLAGAANDIARDDLLQRTPELDEVAFDPDVKLMATLHRSADGRFAAVKGAPESVLGRATGYRGPDGIRPLDDSERGQWLERAEALAAQGLRVIAVAEKPLPDGDHFSYDDLVVVALLALLDPPRGDVQAAIRATQDAGVRVIMVTGDHPATAQKIAEQVGLAEPGARVALGRDLRDIESLAEEERRTLLATSVFARVSPAEKLNLVTLHQKAGSVVAMTGDGVNDAPALKKAEIGIAMGKRGTAVAREASDIILRDDAFVSIVAAIAEGRAIFRNIRSFVVYLLSCNLSEILVIGLATLAGAPLPLLPLQILFLNLVTDVFPALALGMSETTPELMQQKPHRAKEPILGKREWATISIYGAVMTTGVLAAFAIALGPLALGGRGAVTVAFLSLAFAQLLHAFNMRGPKASFVRNEITGNPHVWAAIALCVGILLVALYVAPIAALLHIEPLDSRSWAVVCAAAIFPVVLSPIVRWLSPR